MVLYAQQNTDRGDFTSTVLVSQASKHFASFEVRVQRSAAFRTVTQQNETRIEFAYKAYIVGPIYNLIAGP